MNSNRSFPFLRAVIPWLLLSAAAGHGQESGPGPVGFVRMLAAVSAGTGGLTFMIDGKPVREQGYQLGDVTGGLPLKPGKHEVSFRREGVIEGGTSVEVGQNRTVILIPFSERIPALGNKPEHWEIRILRLRQHDAEGRRTATFVSVSAAPELKVEIRQSDRRWEAVSVKRLGFARTEIRQSKGYLPVRCGDHELSEISVGRTGNHVSVLYDDERGVLRSRTFRDYKYLGTE